MLIYQVTVTVDQARDDAWRAWMSQHHIDDVLATGFFTTAEFARDISNESGNPVYIIRYVCSDQAALNAYQAGPATALKADHNQRFPNLPHVRRDIYEVLAQYP